MEFKILNSNQLKVYFVVKKFEKLVFTTKKIRDSESIVIFDPPNLFENNLKIYIDIKYSKITVLTVFYYLIELLLNISIFELRNFFKVLKL